MRTHAGAMVLALLLGAQGVWAGEQTDWPCFHGSNRDNKSGETGLLEAWPPEGPQLLWTATGIGHGYSSVAVAGDRIFTAGMVDGNTHVAALDLDGETLWQRRAGESWQASERQRWAGPYSGSRATPTVDGDTVFFLSDLGDLTAFDATNGDVRWSLDLAETFEADRPEYGYTESVLVDGDRLFCCPGGTKGYMVALDKRNGSLIWSNTEIDDPIGNSSSVLAELAGSRQVISLTSKRIFAVNPDDGDLLWHYPFGNKRGNSATDVIVHNGQVYASTGYGKGSVLLRPERASNGDFTTRTIWESERLDNHHGGVILVDGYLYGAGHEARGWFCLEVLSGRARWQRAGKGSLTYADGHLYCLEEKGQVSLIRATPEACVEVGRFAVPEGGRGLYWAHPMVSGGRLYVRHSDQLHAYRVRGDSSVGDPGD